MGVTTTVLVIAFIHSLLSAGVVYGWSSLLVTLKQDGEYEERCSSSDPAPCVAQELALNTIFVTGAFAVSGGSVAISPIMDKFGPRALALTGTLLQSLGFVLLGLSSSRTFLAFLPAYAAIGLGGSGVQLSLFHLADLVPSRHGVVTSMISSSFGGGPLVFLAFERLHSLGWSRSGVLSSWALMFSVFFCFISWRLYPNRTVKKGDKLIWNSSTWKADLICVDDESEKTKVDVEEMNVESWSAKDSVFSPVFWAISIVLGLVFIRIDFHLATLGLQLEAKNGATDEIVGALLTVFSFILPLGVGAGFGVGMIIDKLGIIQAHYIIGLSYVVYCAAFMVNTLSMWFWVPVFVLYTACREAAFAMFFVTLGTVFGYDNFGKLSGISLLAGSTIGLVQGWLTAFSLTTLEGDFIGPNIALLGVSVVTLIYPWWLSRQIRKVHSKETTATLE